MQKIKASKTRSELFAEYEAEEVRIAFVDHIQEKAKVMLFKVAKPGYFEPHDDANGFSYERDYSILDAGLHETSGLHIVGMHEKVYVETSFGEFKLDCNKAERIEPDYSERSYNVFETSIQLTIPVLEKILLEAKFKHQHDSSLSDTIKITALGKVDTHLGCERVEVLLKSSYSECNGVNLGTFEEPLPNKDIRLTTTSKIGKWPDYSERRYDVFQIVSGPTKRVIVEFDESVPEHVANGTLKLLARYW